MYKTSYPFFLKVSKNGELVTAALDSPVMKKISFYPSFMFATYDFNEVYSSPDLDEWYLKKSANFALLVVSSWIPNFKFLENYS